MAACASALPGGWRKLGRFLNLCAPSLDLGEFHGWPFADDLAPAQEDLARFAVEGKPIAFVKIMPGEPRLLLGRIDLKRRAADNAGFPQLPGYKCRMGGATADGRQNTGADSKAADIRRVDIGPHQDHRLAALREPRRVGRIESHPAHRNAG